MILKNSSPAPMSCAEFQEQLPDLFAAGGRSSIDDPSLSQHLETCENCTALVRDLQYIADQAKQLLQPTHEPSDSVWKKIQEGLASEPSYAAEPNEK
ncbi:hypothetical protein JAO29_05630 [Edaphobacter sp. HDX4]|uniref:hypothetical protein n=1 Tax=Edaphobacter sp. HDX4 TaxID=2794064 RepID=UPI002FE57DB7